MKCDICGAGTEHPQYLREEYKTKDISTLCPTCADLVNGKLWAIRTMLQRVGEALVKRFMNQRRKRG